MLEEHSLMRKPKGTGHLPSLQAGPWHSHLFPRILMKRESERELRNKGQWLSPSSISNGESQKSGKGPGAFKEKPHHENQKSGEEMIPLVNFRTFLHESTHPVFFFRPYTPSKSPTCSTLLSLCRKIRRKASFYTYSH